MGHICYSGLYVSFFSHQNSLQTIFPSLSKSFWKEKLHFKNMDALLRFIHFPLSPSCCALLHLTGLRRSSSPKAKWRDNFKVSGSLHVTFIIVLCIKMHFMHFCSRIAHSALPANYWSDQAFIQRTRAYWMWQMAVSGPLIHRFTSPFWKAVLSLCK